MRKVTVKGVDIRYKAVKGDDYICLFDIAKYKTEQPDALIANWLRNRNTIEFLGIWETLCNPHFNPLEFEGFRKQAGLNSFLLSPKKWVESTKAIGILSNSGRYGGTYAHKDIAFEFANWISVEFKLHFIKEFQRLKEQEQKQLGWSAKRELARINYRIHTDAIKESLLPAEITEAQKGVPVGLHLFLACCFCAASLRRRRHAEDKGKTRGVGMAKFQCCEYHKSPKTLEKPSGLI